MLVTMRKTVFLCLTIALVGSACRVEGPSRIEAPADSAAGTVSFDFTGPGDAALIVPIHLNGTGPYRFVLDTGATLTCLDEVLADSLDLPENRGQLGYGAGVGGAGNVRLVTVDSLRLGQTKAFDLTTCALDLSQLEQAGMEIDGLLGLNFLKSFRMTLDFGSNTLSLSPLDP